MSNHARIDSAGTTFAIAWSSAGAPRLLHFGARLPDEVDLREFDAALAVGPRESTPDEPQSASLYPTNGFGWMGAAALVGAVRSDAGAADNALDWSDCSVASPGEGRLVVRLRDARSGIGAELSFELDATGVLGARATIRNDGSAAFDLAEAASLHLPLPDWAREIVAFGGDWSREVRPVRFARPAGAWEQVNRTGRTGFQGASVLVCEPSANDDCGQIVAAHLAWSGDHRLRVETLPDGTACLIAGQCFAPGEVVLAPGESLTAPTVYACVSQDGLNGVSRAFHPFVRTRITPPPAAAARKVHFNTWESVYFDFDEASLIELAAKAAELGVERFVLDDGWFSGRRNDRSSLGDWRVDAQRFPNGLGPLIEAVRALGMDFGLWVEPEMVSPDSDLYRAHPDWCVHAPGASRPTMRNQLWLDLSRPEAQDHIFRQLDEMLSQYAVAYLKWDCNRFVFPAAGVNGPGSGAIIRGSYALMDRVRAAHPNVEIESCASGGGRVDLEVLRRANRVWPSDTTDAIERLRVQRWDGLLLPLKVLGSHVGPGLNPITGRRLSMELRARVAMFGHMGVEVDPRRLDDTDRATLAAHIALYKRHRALLHSGDCAYWTTDDGADVRAVVAADRGEALALAVRVGVAPQAVSAPVRFGGLDRGSRYRIALPEPWPHVARRRLSEPETWRAGRIVSGALLEDVGLRLPLSDPETAWLVHLVRL